MPSGEEQRVQGSARVTLDRTMRTRRRDGRGSVTIWSENSLEKIENTKTGSRNELGLFERVKKKKKAKIQQK